MPRHPHFSPSVQEIADSVYSGLAHRLATFQGEVFPLHVGDTWMEPPAGCRMEDLHVAEYPGMHRYAAPQGMPALLDAIVERVRARTGVPTERDNVLVATGATGRPRGGGRRDRDARGRGAAARSALAADHRHRPVVRRRAGRRALLRRRRFPRDRRRGRARAPHRSHHRPLPQHPEQSRRHADPARLDRGAGRVGRPRGSLDPRRRGLRGLRLRRGAHLHPPVRARAHLRGPLLLQGLRHGGQPLRLRGGAGGGRPRAAQDRHAQLLQHADRLADRRPAGARRGRGRLGRAGAGAVPCDRRQGGGPPGAAGAAGEHLPLLRRRSHSSTRPASAASSSAASTAASSSRPARASAPIPPTCASATPPRRPTSSSAASRRSRRCSDGSLRLRSPRRLSYHALHGRGPGSQPARRARAVPGAQRRRSLRSSTACCGARPCRRARTSSPPSSRARSSTCCSRGR